jgi:signal transduction histidine kinase
MGKKLFAAWVAMGLLFLIAGYLFTYQEELRVNLDRIARAHFILSLIYDLQNNLAESEAVVRGFIITGEEKQLKAYPVATREIKELFKELQHVTEDDPELRQLLGNLQPLIGQRLALFEKAIILRREKGFEVGQHSEFTQEVNKVQVEIRNIFDKMEKLEKRQLDPRWARQKEQVKFWLVGLALGGFLTFSILLLVLYLLNREVLQRKKAEELLVAYQADLRSLASQLTLAEERERRRLAVHLHDQIGQSLALSHIKLEELRTSLGDAGSSKLAGEVDYIARLLKQAIEETQSLTFKISPPILYELGLEAALECLTDQFSQQHGVMTYFECDRQPKPLDENLKVLLFQAMQELLTNVVKHAQARSLKVSMWRQGESLRLGVEDDGVGFNPLVPGYRQGKGGGFGLFSIKERLRPLGGSLEVKSEPGGGTEVVLSVPLDLDPPVDKLS